MHAIVSYVTQFHQDLPCASLCSVLLKVFAFLTCFWSIFLDGTCLLYRNGFCHFGNLRRKSGERARIKNLSFRQCDCFMYMTIHSQTMTISKEQRASHIDRSEQSPRIAPSCEAWESNDRSSRATLTCAQVNFRKRTRCAEIMRGEMPVQLVSLISYPPAMWHTNNFSLEDATL